MQPIKFEAHVRHRADLAVIDLHGEIDGFAKQALDQAYDKATQGGARQIVLNFQGATYINSTGLALIVGVLASARKQHREVAAIGLSEHYREIFEITRLADFMSIVA